MTKDLNQPLSVISSTFPDTLVWLPEEDLGFFPVKPSDYPYDQNYWEKYEGYARTELGKAIRETREKFVAQFWDGDLVDVGIGCGDFLEYRNHLGKKTFGNDINEVGVKWLHDRGLFLNPWEEKVAAASFWDVIEHVEFHEPLLRNIEKYLFISVPIFTGPDDVLKSKHFRKDEHYWYWTKASIKRYFGRFGFSCIAESDFETFLGRESIASFAFERIIDK